MPAKKKISPKAVQKGGFLHVRSASGARHEYDIPVRLFAAHPERYELLDQNPVPEARPAVMVAGASASEANDAHLGDSEEESNGE